MMKDRHGFRNTHTPRTSMISQSNEIQSQALKLAVQHTGRVKCLRMGLKCTRHAAGHGSG